MTLPRSKWRLWARDPCFYCGRPTFTGWPNGDPMKHAHVYTRDHLFPRASRPKNASIITVTCCYRCNQLKGNDEPRSFIKKHIAPQRALEIDWKLIERIEAEYGIQPAS